ncbi:MAG: DUF4011 domain-containing protein [Deltaproteobacteria bacterium]|jgi:hypothetical protein|nr:DUF4011 domain-containing protein [Deltaproteobacteria bacterium]
METPAAEARLIADKLAVLRKKVIDLSNRNPLVNVSLSPRSGAIVRVVDELPEVLAFNLRQQRTMTFKALPEIDERDLADERTQKFKLYLNSLKAEDQDYLDFMADQTVGQMATPEELEAQERKLKDKVRDLLGLPPRKAAGAINLERHAADCGIDPDYELPMPQEAPPPKHGDDEIQTLFLPSHLERRLTTLLTKCRTWEEETGINAFHAAFGILRWRDAASKDRQIASPLVMLPVKLEMRRSQRGPRFMVTADGDDCALNFVLSEKLRLEYSLELPEFEPGQNVEDYFLTVREAIADRDKWDLSRQVVFGIFPSARMAIYHDLNPSKAWYSQNPVMADLLRGRQRETPLTVAPRYDVDLPGIERAVHPLALSADSSQVRVIHDVLAGENMALEGPPGTGKSQSIVNVIAAALKNGKKILFVAEKMAALEVVKSRLEAIGLGAFLLPLQANRSERGKVFEGLRDRLNMAPPAKPDDPGYLRILFDESKKCLNAYINLISQPFGSTGLSVREVLGRFRATDHLLVGAPKALANPAVPDPESLGPYGIGSLKKCASELEAAALQAAGAQTHWAGVTVENLDAFSAKVITDAAAALADAIGAIQTAGAGLSDLGVTGIGESDIQPALDFLSGIEALGPGLDFALAERLSEPGKVDAAQRFLAGAGRHAFLKDRLGAVLAGPDSPESVDRLGEAVDLASKGGFASLDPVGWAGELETLRSRLAAIGADLGSLAPLAQAAPEVAGRSLASLAAARNLAARYGPGVLALRPKTPPPSALLARLDALIAQGLVLKVRENDLSSRFPVKTAPGFIPAPAALSGAAAELQKGGIFRALSGSYRRAKAMYLSLTGGAPFEAKAAARELADLASFMAGKQALEESAELKSSFPEIFFGLASDFNLMGGYVGFYRDIENECQGLANQETRDLLYYADSNVLLSIPGSFSGEADNLGALRELQGTLTGRLAEAGAAFEALSRLLSLDGNLKPGRPLFAGDPGAIDSFIAEARSPFPDPVAGECPNFPALPAARAILALAQKRLGLKAALAADDGARELLGDKFMGPDTPPGAIEPELRALDLIGASGPMGQSLFRAVAAGRQGESRALLSTLWDSRQKAFGNLNSITNLTGLDLAAKMSSMSPWEAMTLTNDLAADQSGLFAHSALAKAKASAMDLGLGWFLSAYGDEGAPLKNLATVLEAAIYKAMALRVRELHGDGLLAFSSARLNGFRDDLARADSALTEWARRDLAHKLHLGAKPPVGKSVGLKKDFTEYSLILHETGKKKQFIPVRRLIARAARALLELKPCWMMSPTAVSQYLTDESLTFDLGILDEASQMPPENAIASLARCAQILVVGDTNQLPPTNFFKKNVMGELGSDDDPNGESEAIEESILDLAKTIYVPMRRLTWHYRSRHSGLINFCNRFIYGNELVVYPSPTEKSPDMGVRLVRVKDGLYQKSRNPAEARAMAEAALAHMKNEPDRSLGLVTFNEKQRDFIIDLMERAIEANDYAMRYVEKWKSKNDGLETFFVKNLENVQGDERDAIFIGTVYGPEKPGGPVAQRFGPVSGPAGRRRLNVLFSRAKRKIVTFTSMSPAEIKASPDAPTGPAMLREWLAYCESEGSAHKLTVGEPGQAQAMTLESHVRSKVESLGFPVDPEVGTKGYRLDMAVKSDRYPLGYVAGLESDGGSYVNGVSVRDRDRLRPEVLKGLGWKLRRVWTSGWYANPEGEFALLASGLKEDLAGALQDLAKLPRPPAEKVGSGVTKSQGAVESKASTAGPAPMRDGARRVGVGDMVRIKYLGNSPKTEEILITESETDPEKSLHSKASPLGKALMDMEEEDQVLFKVKNTVRGVLIESITKRPET